MFIYYINIDQTTMIMIIVVVVVLVCISCGVGVYFATKSESPAPPAKKTDTKTDNKKTDTKTPPPQDCPDRGFGTGKPGITKIVQDCALGPSYKGNMIRICNAQGEWIIDNLCVSGGLADKLDISGKWNYWVGGNDMGIIDVVFNMSTGIGLMSGGNIPANINPGQTTITYKDGLGYQVYYPYNQFAKFTDSTYTRLEGGNYYFEKLKK